MQAAHLLHAFAHSRVAHVKPYENRGGLYDRDFSVWNAIVSWYTANKTLWD